MDQENVSIARYRGSKLNKIKELDWFPKIDERYKQTSIVGGFFSSLSYYLIFMLIYTETRYYFKSELKFKFTPDTDFDAKLKINVDITVAMPCSNLGADILDSTNQNMFKFGSLEEEDTWFELAPNQKKHFDNKVHLNSYVREEYHAIQEFLWRSSHPNMFQDLPPRSVKPNRPFDACRIYGSLILNKVAGNFHITAGKSLNLPRGHIHISAFVSEREYNFSHRIDRLSFGDPSAGIIHPLDGDEFIANTASMLYQYFVEVVPTTVKTYLSKKDTYQYSVKELARPINHSQGSHGMPGIFFKYDVSALRVHVNIERGNFGVFIARLCSIISGIYVISGYINSITQSLTSLFFKETKTKRANGRDNQVPDVPASVIKS